MLQEAQLKIALLEYIKKHHPNDTDKIEMLSIRFGMHREIGEQYEETGEKEIRAIISKFSGLHSLLSHFFVCSLL